VSVFSEHSVHSYLRVLDKISVVDYTETTMEWKQWTVDDSELEDDNKDTA